MNYDFNKEGIEALVEMLDESYSYIRCPPGEAGKECRGILCMTCWREWFEGHEHYDFNE